MLSLVAHTLKNSQLTCGDIPHNRRDGTLERRPAYEAAGNLTNAGSILLLDNVQSRSSSDLFVRQSDRGKRR
jgi:hypothetical protein